MNNVILIGRLTADPEVRYTQGETPMCIARYTLAVDRRFKRDGEPTADFIRCIAFGKSGEFAQSYLCKGFKIAVTGRIQTGSYEKDGQKVYTTDVIVEQQEFAESRQDRAKDTYEKSVGNANDGFMAIPEGMAEDLPF